MAEKTKEDLELADKIKSQKDKRKRVTSEKARLNGIFKDLDPKKKNSLQGLIDEAAFMKATLFEIKELIDEFGVIDEMPQGEYSILREHPAFKSYNSMVQRYTTVTEKLFNLFPKEELKVAEKDDGFNDFAGDR